MSEAVNRKRVCVIGCGPSGMSMLHHLGKLPDEQLPEVVCYEKQDKIGGMWNVTWRTGLDEHGEPSHPSMYYDLFVNNPKESFEYPDYTYEDHFGKLLPSYPPRATVRDYIEGRFIRGSKRDMSKCVKLSTVVRRVEYNKDSDDFKIITKNLKENKEKTERFSHVVVASGAFGNPYIPLIPGIDEFKGRVLHSKNVRHFSEFKGQRILAIGSAWSGEDIAMLSMKFGASSVIISYNFQPWLPKWPLGIQERPLVERFRGYTAYFKDGTTAEVDLVILCTGYRIELPFLSDDLAIKTELSLYPENLYKGILWLKGGNNKLMYLGLQYNVYCFVLYDAQAIWACRNIIGTQLLPSKEEMLAENMQWVQKAKETTKDYGVRRGFMTSYFRYMVEEVCYRKDVLEIETLLNEMTKYRTDDLCTWRDQQHRCIYTGKVTPPPKIPFLKNFDDSLEAYTEQYECKVEVKQRSGIDTINLHHPSKTQD